MDAGLTEDELRGVLRRSIAKTLGTPRRVLLCSVCLVDYELSDRRARDRLANGEPPRCRRCAQNEVPGSDMNAWITTLPPDVREQAVAALAISLPDHSAG